MDARDKFVGAILLIILIVVIILLLLGTSRGFRRGCKSDSDCENGVCHNRKCYECAFDRDCAGTSTCVNRTCTSVGGDNGGGPAPPPADPCPSVTILTPDPPILEDPPTLFYTGLVPFGGNPETPNFETGSGGYYCNFSQSYNMDNTWPACSIDRTGTLDTSARAGRVELSASNSNPNGGYIMSSMHDELDTTLPNNWVVYSYALTQNEVDSGEFFQWFTTFQAFFNPIEVNMFAVSEWVPLNPTCTIVNGVAQVEWIDPFANCPEGSPLGWEIAVSVKDNVTICGSLNFTNMNLGTIVPITETSVDIQLYTGTSDPVHNITLCEAYAYPILNKSSDATFQVGACAN